MFQILRNFNSCVKTQTKWLNIVGNRIESQYFATASSTNVASAQEKTGVERLQQIFDTDEKSGDIVSALYNIFCFVNFLKVSFDP